MISKRHSAQTASDSAADFTRHLVLVPVLHAPADMGQMAEGLAAAIVDRLGRRHWEEYLAMIDGFWQKLRREVEALALDFAKVDLYQDGLPVCGKELDIVRKAATAGSENHCLLLDLVARGATLMGTEDPRLLLEEYRDVQAALAWRGESSAHVESTGQDQRHMQTMAKRDAYIGRRIGHSLRPGRTGILFLGMLHDVEKQLPPDIFVTRLILKG